MHKQSGVSSAWQGWQKNEEAGCAGKRWHKLCCVVEEEVCPARAANRPPACGGIRVPREGMRANANKVRKVRRHGKAWKAPQRIRNLNRRIGIQERVEEGRRELNQWNGIKVQYGEQNGNRKWGSAGAYVCVVVKGTRVWRGSGSKGGSNGMRWQAYAAVACARRCVEGGGQGARENKGKAGRGGARSGQGVWYVVCVKMQKVCAGVVCKSVCKGMCVWAK